MFNTGLQKVALISNANVLGATANGRAVPLVAEGQTQAALLQGLGPFTATLDWGAPVAVQPGRASFVLPVPHTGTARATIDLPGDQADVRIVHGLVIQRRAANGRTVIDVTLRPGSQAEVSWTMRDSAPVAATREARAVADVLTLVTIGESDVRMTALVDVAVVQGEPRTFEARLPAGLRSHQYFRQLARITTIAPAPSSSTSAMPRCGGTSSSSASNARTSPARSSFETAMVSLPGMQRERGEIAVEGIGTLDLTRRIATGCTASMSAS